MGQPRRTGSDSGAVRAAERRRAPRVLVDLEVDYDSEDNFLFAYITDISTTGIFIKTVTPEPRGTELNLRFRPEGEEPFAVEGEVIWINDLRPEDRDNLSPGMGVRFLRLDDEMKQRLYDLVRRIAYLS
jgi:uncharacterized protein (TIGR02266 family)